MNADSGREDALRREMASEGFELRKLPDGRFIVLEEGEPIAPGGYRVRTWGPSKGDRVPGRHISDPAPLSLARVEAWFRLSGPELIEAWRKLDDEEDAR